MNFIKHALLSCALFAGFAAPAFSQARPGSIFDVNRGGVSFIADKIASRPGDLITVIINEAQNISNQEATGLSNSTSTDYSVLKAELLGQVFNTLPTVGGSSTDSFSGSASYSKQGNFSARLTAIVTDVTSQGNMVVEGRREVRIDGETKVIEFRGILRRVDVTAMNTIDSELVADATVSYSGSGPMTKATQRNGIGSYIHDAISWIWPF